MRKTNVISCLVISPSDVQAERESLVRTMERWNATVGRTMDCFVHGVRWETQVAPLQGGPPQSIVNSQVVDSCDCGVAVFWSRIGTETTSAASGSIEEIRRIREAGGEVLVYHCTRDIPQAALDVDQVAGLNRSLDGLRSSGIVGEYCLIQDLESQFMGHLTAVVQRLRESTAPGTSATEPVSETSLCVRTQWAVAHAPGGPKSMVVVSIQNRSSGPVHLGTFKIELDDGQFAFPRFDAFGRPPTVHGTLLPGAAFDLYLAFADLHAISQEFSATPRRVQVKDQVERIYWSSEKEMALALANGERWEEARDGTT